MYTTGITCHVSGAVVKLRESFKINDQHTTALNVNTRQSKKSI